MEPDIRWVTVFVDRPAAGFADVREFWRQVTGTTMSPTRGSHDEFATFVPAEGDAWLKIQRVHDGPGGSHLDLHVAAPRDLADRAIDRGAVELDTFGDVVVLRSPGGFVFCAVPTRVAGLPSAPVGEPGHRTTIAEIVLDAPSDAFGDEYEFWAAVTGWPRRPVDDPAFASFDRVAGLPLRLVVQRRDESGGHVTGHLDVRCDDMATTVADHVALGAQVVAAHPAWTVLVDPAGQPYCVLDERVGG